MHRISIHTKKTPNLQTISINSLSNNTIMSCAKQFFTVHQQLPHSMSFSLSAAFLPFRYTSLSREYSQYTLVHFMRNSPERFIVSSIDHSLVRYLAYIIMSHQDTRADAIVIKAVTGAFNWTIQILECNPGFAKVTDISPVSSETDATVINIGYPDELHHVSTFPFEEEAMADIVIYNNQPPKTHHNQISLTQNAMSYRLWQTNLTGCKFGAGEYGELFSMAFLCNRL